MDEEVIIIGAGGQGKVVADIIRLSGDKVIGFLDDNPNLKGNFAGAPVLGRVEEYKWFPDVQYIIAIGNAAARETIASRLPGVRWHRAVHPSAVISSLDTQVGEGTVVMAQAVINPGAVIGKHCIINSGAIVEHDNVIEDFAHISVGAKLGGNVHIGKRTWIGIGGVVRNNLSVCGDCVIGAGGVVVKGINKAGVYIGVPAKSLKGRNE